MQALRIFSLVLISWVLSVSTLSAEPLTTQDKAKQVWQLLDYLAVDYGGSVKDNRVTNEAEYVEMQEFAQTIERQLGELPPGPTSEQLGKEAGALRLSIAAKASPETVAELARKLASGVLTAYPVPMAPSKAPDLQKGAKLYQSQCASCHGVSGNADGPLAAKLNPPPIALADHARAQERSIFALQQIITRGVEGTSMPGFAHLSEDDRWALAYFASTMSYSDAERQAGAKVWTADSNLRGTIPTLDKLSQTSEAALAKSVGAQTARDALAYLRSSPDVLAASTTDSLSIAKDKLKESIAAMDKGDTRAASQLALSAYLDGFEPVEPALAAKNQSLFLEIEKIMGLYRNAVTNGQAERAHGIATQLQSKLDEAQEALAGANDAVSTFLGAFTILLREGLEALLVVVAMLAFLKKAKRTDVLPYVHAGWVTALGAGGLTWAVATYVVDLSGASREMTEGFSAVFAAIALLGVGMWMHQKSLAGRWQSYVKEKLSSALNRKSAFMLFLLSFVTVYREVFETVLFYAALWSDGNGAYMLAGLGSGIAVLAVIATVLLRSTARLPIRQFFSFSSALVGVLAVVLIGKGVAALQKVGLLQVTPLSMPRIDVLGLYPSVQTIAAQGAILLIIVASVTYNLRSQHTAKV
ncbi:FTR1 family protein [Cupriavidus sp. Agwp_2]|uniref:FTR1 family protein n=1 Tax=Cupriavidus sp. Agwp_2 TaxID=2897324 RepID=UPI0034600C01